ncbi:hypothetical protein [uncultured Bradyrhizobium sp.]|uniref:hypothetical protein n=1 Tax=uncultured Bradyrhizobium sp. TaxID=199684 RepID=UPI00261E8F77|nr:hypothetical protein [uncultured Bradyrhizobium sp.]
MNAITGPLRPTEGQLALARILADGGRAREPGITHVDADAYISPARHAAEQERIFAKTPLVGGQWRLSGDKYDMVITDNRLAPQIPLGGDMQALS